MRNKFIGIVCIIYSIIIMYVYFMGYLGNYLSPSMHKNILITCPFLIILGLTLIIIKDRHHTSFKISDIVLLIPAFMLIFADNGRITTTLANNRSSSFNNINNKNEEKNINNEDEEISIDDLIKYDFSSVDFDVIDEAYSMLANVITFNDNIDQFVGKTIRVKGFTLFDNELIPKNHFAIGKYIISCCVADADFGGFIVKYDKLKNIKNNTWYEIEGILEKGHDTYGNNIAVINALSVKKIDGEKEELYVYPCYSYDNGYCHALEKYDIIY